MAKTNITTRISRRTVSRAVYSGQESSVLTKYAVELGTTIFPYTNLVPVLESPEDTGEIWWMASPAMLNISSTSDTPEAVVGRFARADREEVRPRGLPDYAKTSWSELTRISHAIEVDTQTELEPISKIMTQAELTEFLKRELEYVVAYDLTRQLLNPSNYHSDFHLELSGEGAGAGNCWVLSSGAVNHDARPLEDIVNGINALRNRWGAYPIDIWMGAEAFKGLSCNQNVIMGLPTNTLRAPVSEDIIKAYFASFGVANVYVVSDGYTIGEDPTRTENFVPFFGEEVYIGFTPNVTGNKIKSPASVVYIKRAGFEWLVTPYTINDRATVTGVRIDHFYQVFRNSSINYAGYLITNVRA